jgi:glycosyltransferase involved in cell wall biosynthesis
MSDSRLNVLHLVAEDTPATRLETLEALCREPEVGRPRVLYVGSGYINSTGLSAVEHVPAPFGIGRLAVRRLRRAIPAPDQTVLHVWSAKAVSWMVPAVVSGADVALAGQHHRLFVDAEAPLDFRRLANSLSRLRSMATLGFVCPTRTCQRRLVAAGLPADECAVIRDSVDVADVDAARRPDVRPLLDLSPEHTVVLALPPVRRETGAFVAAWATMLLAQVRRDVRLIVPDGGREAGRVTRLVDSCRHRWLLRSAGPDLALCKLLAAADLAIYLPPGDAPLGGVLSALAAGRTIVASVAPVTTELLTDGRNAWLCRPNNPKDAAARMLQALENPQMSQQQADLARSQMLPVFSRSRMVRQYARAYENLLAGRRIGDGIEDGALMR